LVGFAAGSTLLIPHVGQQAAARADCVKLINTHTHTHTHSPNRQQQMHTCVHTHTHTTHSTHLIHIRSIEFKKHVWKKMPAPILIK